MRSDAYRSWLARDLTKELEKDKDRHAAHG
jgi:hypothetical protein